jgi:hypothetical protein
MGNGFEALSETGPIGYRRRGLIRAVAGFAESNRKIAARLPRLCSRQVERQMIPDYCDFTTGSAFSATGQLPTRGALDTANWRG